MDATYERTLDRVSLILKDGTVEKADGFETKMVCVGGVPGLLPMSVRQMDGETVYVYEVTARQPLSEHLKGRPLLCPELTEILETVLGILEELETYLLKADHLLFSADRIFARGSFRDLRFCYVPSHSRPMREALYGLVMELIAGTDPRDRDAIVLGYRFAHELQEENVSYTDLRECLHANAAETEDSVLNAAACGFAGKLPGDSDSLAGDLPKGPEIFAGNLSGGPDSFAGSSPQNASGGIGRAPAKNIFSGAGWAARLGINRRTVFIVLIGGVVLLAAWLCMHPEPAENLLTAAQTKPLLWGGAAALLAAAVSLVLIRKKRASEHMERSAAAYAGADKWLYTDGSRERGEPVHEHNGDTGSLNVFKRNAAAEGIFGRRVKSGEGTPAFCGAGSGAPEGTSAFDRAGSGAPEGMPAFNGTGSGVSAGAACAGKAPFVPGGISDEDTLATCILAPAKKRSAARLLPVKKAEAYGEILLEKDDTLLGKQSGLADIVIPAPVVSRVHARISRRGDSWYLTDLNSRNGTAVNNVLLQSMREAQIQNGDILRFADLEYVLETEPAFPETR